jgi:Na+/H+ antiporter NhaA
VDSCWWPRPALALVLANSPFSHVYDGFREIPLTVRVGALTIDKPLLLWINDGLMVIFFFLVGLEIKGRAVELRSRRAATCGRGWGHARDGAYLCCHQ